MPRTNRPLQTACIIQMFPTSFSYDSDWSESTSWSLLRAQGAARGHDFGRYRNALLYRKGHLAVDVPLNNENFESQAGVDDGYDSMEFASGIAAGLLDFCAMFNLVIFVGALPPANLIKHIRYRNPEARTAYFGPMTWIRHNAGLDAVSNAITGAMDGASVKDGTTDMTTTGAPLSCPAVDRNEAVVDPYNGHSGCRGTTAAPVDYRHTWEFDVTATPLAAAQNWREGWGTAISTRFAGGELDDFIGREIADDFTVGSSTTVPTVPTTADFRTYVKECLKNRSVGLSGGNPTYRFKKMWAEHDLDLSAYSAVDMPNRLASAFFHVNDDHSNANAKPWATIESEIKRFFQTGGRGLLIGHRLSSSVSNFNAGTIDAADQWATKQNGPGGAAGTWAKLHNLVHALGVHEKVWIVSFEGHSEPPGTGATGGNAHPGAPVFSNPYLHRPV